MSLSNVPAELRKLVSESLRCLGEIIETQEGKKFYDEIENLRLLTRSLREAPSDEVFSQLQTYFEVFQKNNDSKKVEKITRSFGLALELINVCETAYRSFRVQHASLMLSSDSSLQPTSITWVFTAHPTEARTNEAIDLFRRIQNLLLEALQGLRVHFPSEELKFLLTLAWHTEIAPDAKPTVEDEAKHILNIVLADDSQKMITNFTRDSNQRIRLRTWVGGDKDGHPGVGAKQTLNSLQLSRATIVSKIQRLIESLLSDIHSQNITADPQDQKILDLPLKKLKNATKSFSKLKAKDGEKIEKWKRLFSTTCEYAVKKIGTTPSQFLKIQSLIELFPSLVLPLEMREDASVLSDIKKSSIKKQRTFPIVQMLSQIRTLSGGQPQAYVQGFIISQCNSALDFSNAMGLVQDYLKDESLPVIPLFETRHALETSGEMVEKILADTHVLKTIKNKWNQKFEVMVGYSDSAKEVGVLSSRFLISKALPEISKICQKHDLTPVFFHGSGGSISRGGGSTSEQCSWWPAEARKRIKMTIQGEMVQRSFASAPILLQNLKKLLQQNQGPVPTNYEVSSSLEWFVAKQEQEYQKLVSEPDFLKMISDATPYEYLQFLKIGSRPASRKKLEGIASLRAIPWVLCWTQTRSLLPVWWGVGSAWKAASPEDREQIKNDFQKSSLFSSYVKQLGFSLAKVEPGIWKMYLKNLSTHPKYTDEFFERFENEFQSACDFVRGMSGEDNLVWFRPWLGASIRVRSPMIYPVHLAQLWSLKKQDVSLMRQTVTAIASGMLTTG